MSGYGYPGGYGGYGYDPRYAGYGSPYGGYAQPSGGWYSGYYYPGSGVYVYDRERRRHRMTDAQRRYWEQRRAQRLANPAVRDNIRTYRADRRGDRREYRIERREDRGELRRREVTREQYQADRRQDRREYRREQREDRRELRRENRRDSQPE